MATAKVTCCVCKERVYKDNAINVAPRKYCCIDCKETYDNDGETFSPIQLLKNYINELYAGEVNWMVLSAQIKKLHDEDKLKYEGMLLALQYYIEIEGNTFNELFGIKFIIERTYPLAKALYLSTRDINKVVSELEDDEVVIRKVNLDNAPRIYYSVKRIDED